MEHSGSLVELIRLALVVRRTTRYCLGVLISGFVNLYIIRIFKPLLVFLILLLLLILDNFILLPQEFIVDLYGSLFELSGSTFGHDVLFFSRGSLSGHLVGCSIVD